MSFFHLSSMPFWMETVLTRMVQVNRMCSSLTDQVRSIAFVTTAVAKGDLTQKIDIEVEGEMATLKGVFTFPITLLPIHR